jgi:hypothetical protein
MPSHLHTILKPEKDAIGETLQQFGSFTAQDIQAKNIYSEDFLWQKMEYIHQNPVAKEWKLVNDRADYQYSSAGHYDYGKKLTIGITDINEWLTFNTSAEDGGKSEK